MADFELISGFVLVSLSFIFTILAVLLKNKVLRLFFLMILVFTLPLNFGYMLEMVRLHDVGNLGGLINLLGTGLFVSVFAAVTVVGYLMILLITFSLEKINNMVREEKRLPEEPLLLDEALE